jgi:hypothetical protein
VEGPPRRDTLSETLASLTSRFAKSSDYQIEVVCTDAGDELAYTIASSTTS